MNKRRENKESMIRWLHISDLHFNNDDMSTSLLREALPEYLKNENIHCDYVFCTRDIRTANADPNKFTDEAAQYLIDFCAAVGTGLDRLFIVAGNHDVDRNIAGRDEAVRRICFQRAGYHDPKYGKINEESIGDGEQWLFICPGWYFKCTKYTIIA